MDLIKITQLLSASNLREYRDDDYWVDRLCHRYSIVIFSVFAVLVTTKAYIGDPIDCWAPPEFKASYERYAETLCFVNGTYYISSTEIDIPLDPSQRYSNRIRYYQWTPFILLLQALTMYLPRLIWLSMNTKYGINLRNLVDAAKKYESIDSYFDKEKILVYICKNLLRTIQYNEYSNNKKYMKSDDTKLVYLNHKHEIDRMLYELSNEKCNKSRSRSSSSPRSSSPDRRRVKISEKNLLINQTEKIPSKTSDLNLSKTYLSTLYLIIKFFYLLISIGQLFFLNRLIGNNFYLIGITLLKTFFYEIEWPHMDVFPRMTLCEIYIREVGTVHPYLIQCVLRINLFNEVIFVLVWYWLVFCCVMTMGDLIVKLLTLVLFSNYHRKLFALKYLELIHLKDVKDTNEHEEDEVEMFEKFCQIYFNNDTIFSLKVIEQNASSLIVSEIIENLWLKFKRINFELDEIEVNRKLLLKVNKNKHRKLSESSGSEFNESKRKKSKRKSTMQI